MRSNFVKHFSVREILEAKSRKPGGGCNVERRGQQGEQYIDATTGDLKLNSDSRTRHHATADNSQTVPTLRDGIPGLPTDRLRTRMRSRTGRGHARLRTGHGQTVATDISAAIWPDRLRIHRDCFADAKTSF